MSVGDRVLLDGCESDPLVAEVRFVLADKPEVEFLGERSVDGTRNLRLAELDTAGRAEGQQLVATAREARARPPEASCRSEHLAKFVSTAC